MRNMGLRGILMLVAYSLLAWLLIRWGGGWEITARVMTAVLAGVLGAFGVHHMITTSLKRPATRCHVETCTNRGPRTCDFKMFDGKSCGWPCCYQHIHIIGKMEYCESHYEQEGRP